MAATPALAARVAWAMWETAQRPEMLLAAAGEVATLPVAQAPPAAMAK
jgi:hypothetical protein